MSGVRVKIQSRADVHYYDPDGTTWCGAATPPGYGHPECERDGRWPISDGTVCPSCHRPICILCVDQAYDLAAEGKNPWIGKAEVWQPFGRAGADLIRVVSV